MLLVPANDDFCKSSVIISITCLFIHVLCETHIIPSLTRLFHPPQLFMPLIRYLVHFMYFHDKLVHIFIFIFMHEDHHIPEKFKRYAQDFINLKQLVRQVMFRIIIFQISELILANNFLNQFFKILNILL
jgi:hypothetical protein